MKRTAIKLDLKENTTLEVTYDDGKVISFDMASMFDKYPNMKILEDRDFFLKGKLLGTSGIYWDDQIDFDVDSIYDCGLLVKTEKLDLKTRIGNLIKETRLSQNITQKELSMMCGIDQSDLSKIERGSMNPSLNTIEKIFNALERNLDINIINI